jgi:hypothetical protein
MAAITSVVFFAGADCLDQIEPAFRDWFESDVVMLLGAVALRGRCLHALKNFAKQAPSVVIHDELPPTSAPLASNCVALVPCYAAATTTAKPTPAAERLPTTIARQAISRASSISAFHMEVLPRLARRQTRSVNVRFLPPRARPLPLTYDAATVARFTKYRFQRAPKRQLWNGEFRRDLWRYETRGLLSES